MPPGEAFSYSSRGSHLVSAVLREALVRADGDDPRTVLEYAREKLFDPLEIDSSGAPERRVSLGDPAYDVSPASTGAPMQPGCTRHAACSDCGRRHDQARRALSGGRRLARQAESCPTGWVDRRSTAESNRARSTGSCGGCHHRPDDGHHFCVARRLCGQLIAIAPEHSAGSRRSAQCRRRRGDSIRDEVALW